MPYWFWILVGIAIGMCLAVPVFALMVLAGRDSEAERRAAARGEN